MKRETIKNITLLVLKMSMLELLWSPSYVSFFLSGCSDSNSQDLEKNVCGRNSKLIKPVGVPKSYRPIFLLGVSYKILEKLIYARVKPIIDPLLPREQAEVRREKSTVDQVILLVKNIRFFLSICQSDSGIWLFMAFFPYMQAAWDLCQINTW